MSADKIYTDQNLYEIQEYIKYAEALLFYLKTGMKPIEMKRGDFKLFQSLLTNLVESGKLDHSALDIFANPV